MQLDRQLHCGEAERGVVLPLDIIQHECKAVL